MIRSEVTRCSDILAELAVDAGQARGNPPHVRLGELIASVKRGLGDNAPIVTQLDAALAAREIRTHVRLLTRALKSIVDNGLDAVGEGGQVRLEAQLLGDRLSLSVVDDGPGMWPRGSGARSRPRSSPQTKPTGQGMGLGLFLAASVAEQLGGELQLRSELGSGTAVTLEIPA